MLLVAMTAIIAVSATFLPTIVQKFQTMLNNQANLYRDVAHMCFLCLIASAI